MKRQVKQYDEEFKKSSVELFFHWQLHAANTGNHVKNTCAR